ncbi:MAG: hypothetical protein ACK4TF_04695 [Thermodesulfovibrionales bacterium]
MEKYLFIKYLSGLLERGDFLRRVFTIYLHCSGFLIITILFPVFMERPSSRDLPL